MTTGLKTIDDHTISMLVYGIRCAPADLTGLPSDAMADYYMDYSLLIFPSYTRPTCVNSYGHLTPTFWAEVQRTVGSPRKVHQVDLELPFITEGEYAVCKALQTWYPTIDAAWYYVPRVVYSEPPSLQVSDL